MSTLVDRLRDAFAAAAADACRRFRGGRNGYIDGLAVVHSVRLQAWFGLQVPGPGCHVGVGSWDFTRFRPTTKAVTCLRCLRAGASPEPTADHPDQIHLDLAVLNTT